MKALLINPKFRKWSCFLIVTAGLFLVFSSIAMAQTKPINDSAITRSIEERLQRNPNIASNLIDVSTREGIVTLTGSVNNILAKDMAVDLAEATKGVRSVVNQILVKPIIRKDSEIKKDVQEALLYDPAADSYEIDVAVNGGVVTLTGTVDSWHESRLSSQIARSVRGVVDVQNLVQVELKEDRTDQEIREDIESRLQMDVQVNETLIDVEVIDGKVKLGGTVASVAEKSRATMDAWVTGVTSVDNSRLGISWTMDEKMARDPQYFIRSDKEIKDAVKDAFLYDPRVLSFNPEVEVENGKVTLTGVVDNLAAKRAAEQDARNTVGVWWVKNLIKVRPVETPTDDKLADRVRNSFSRNPLLEKQKIEVTVLNSQVFLDGTVNYRYEKNLAEELASNINGVIAVQNNLDVKSNWMKRSDWEIKQDIISEFWWSVYVDGDDITVGVNDGVATLTGTVDTWVEYQAAEENAFEGGARKVKNYLDIAYAPSFYYLP